MDATHSSSLPPEIEAAVALNHGGPVPVIGVHGSYVVMNADVYSDQMTEASAIQYTDSIAAIKRSLAQAAAGELHDAERFLDELAEKYEA
jgi:hypothetical protein